MNVTLRVHPRGSSGLTFVVLAALVGSLVTGGCSTPPVPTATSPAAQVIQKLLELRFARSRDVSAYRLFFRADSAVPVSLVEAAADEASSTKPPTPEWDPPYVSSSTTSSAEVVVVWKKSDVFPDHSAATVFSVARQQDRWVILSAREVGAAASIPKPMRSGP